MFRNIRTSLERSKTYASNWLCHFAIGVIGLAAVLLIGILAYGQCIIAQQKGITITPNEKIQSFLNGLLSSNKQEMFSGTEEQLQKKFAELKKMVDGRHEKLIPELIYYSMHAKSMREAMLAGVVIEQLGISKESIVLGIVPYLDTKDEQLRSTLYNWLGGIDSDDDLPKKPDFSIYEAIIRERDSNVSEGLIEYMYQKSPKETQSVLRRVYIEGGGTIPAFIQKVLNRTPEK